MDTLAQRAMKKKGTEWEGRILDEKMIAGREEIMTSISTRVLSTTPCTGNAVATLVVDTTPAHLRSPTAPITPQTTASASEFR
jgi:hypothetical protein